jgi:hypothetical protein
MTLLAIIDTILVVKKSTSTKKMGGLIGKVGSQARAGVGPQDQRYYSGSENKARC